LSERPELFAARGGEIEERYARATRQHLGADDPDEPQVDLKTYHATMRVTRAEEWCVEAGSPEEARELLEAWGTAAI
jgi:hypothetical protein